MRRSSGCRELTEQQNGRDEVGHEHDGHHGRNEAVDTAPAVSLKTGLLLQYAATVEDDDDECELALLAASAALLRPNIRIRLLLYARPKPASPGRASS